MKIRSFNTISIDDNIVTKRSDNRKLLDEINWYKRISDCSLSCISKVHIPDIYDYGKVGRKYFYSLDKIDGELLSDIYMKNIDDLKRQLYLLSKALLVVTELRNLKPLYLSKKECAELIQKECLDKTINRLNQYQKFSELKHLEIEVNFEKISSFDMLWKKLVNTVKTLSVKSRRYFSVIHGDLNYSNIFLSEKISIIDPKGRFGEQISIHGDYRYDLAKIRQSYHSGYFQVLHNRYKILKEDNILKIKILDYPSQDIIDRLDDKIEEYGVKLLEIQFFESLLLLSLIPLHSENRELQIIMYIIGVAMLNKTLNKEVYKMDTELIVRW